MPEHNLALSSPTGSLSTSRAPKPHLVIRPVASRWQRINPREIWRYRELIYFFTLRDLKLRYKQTALGAFWTVLQPILTTGVFSMLFGKMANIGSDGIPYPVFCFSALVPWTYFANALGRGATSLVSNSHLLNKIYFPRILIPVSSLVPGLIDFGIGFAMLVPLALWYGFRPTWVMLVATPLLVLLLFTCVLGFTLWLSAINVRFRDVSNVLPFIIQIWMFLTPVIYPAGMLGRFQWIFAFNPLVGIIGGFRSAVFDTAWNFQSLGSAAGISLLVFLTGLFAFGGMERSFADKV